MTGEVGELQARKHALVIVLVGQVDFAAMQEHALDLALVKFFGAVTVRQNYLSHSLPRLS